jgi:hypothetical protein
MEQSFNQQVKAALATITGQVSIAEAEATVRQILNGVIDERGKELADDALRSVIRHQFRQSRDNDGLCEWASVERRLANGDTEKVYKQLSMFNKEDFKIQIDYHAQQATYHARTANTLASRCNMVHKTRRQLPFPSFGFLNDWMEKSA